MNTIPVMDDPMGAYWKQPHDMTSVPFDDAHALITSQQFDGLAEYSRSTPSGVYPGKCWKAQTVLGEWYLCWFGPDNGDGLLKTFSRKILVLGMKGGE